MKSSVLIIVLLLLVGISNGLTGKDYVTQGEGLSWSDSVLLESAQIDIPSDTLKPEKRKIEEPVFEPGGALITFWIGVIALLSGYFNPIGILIAGGVFLVVGIVLLLFYNKLRKANPFNSRKHNIIGKIILGLFFFLLLLAMIGAIILAFVVAVALLLAALLSTVVSPVVVACTIIGAGVLWMLINLIIYLVKRRKYKKSLQ